MTTHLLWRMHIQHPSLVVESGKIKNVVLKWNSIFGESIKQETFI
jgi:hypothetical protein